MGQFLRGGGRAFSISESGHSLKAVVLLVMAHGKDDEEEGWLDGRGDV